jgi:HPt (histidine-containing phosphotransfer) domain-containing protein
VSDTFQIQLSGLKRRFCDRAIGQSVDLEKIAAHLEEGASVSRCGEDIRTIAHSLAGASGVFGFGDLSELAIELHELTRHSPGSAELVRGCRALASEIKRAQSSRNASDVI